VPLRSVFGSSHQWNLYASTGATSLGGSFISKNQGLAGIPSTLFCKIAIVGQYYARDDSDTNFHARTEDFLVSLPQVILDRTKLELLVLALERYQVDPFNFSFDLAAPRDHEQHFKIIFDTATDSSINHGKGECRIIYCGGDFAVGDWLFDIDLSCIGIFCEELKSALTEAVKL
jgi:hypothetical protein